MRFESYKVIFSAAIDLSISQIFGLIRACPTRTRNSLSWN